MVDDFQIFKEEVKARCDIVDVVGEFVELKKKGNSYLGLCPFHSEKTPSFNVNRSEQFYYCFGCGKGGDIFRFLMDVTGMSFMEALEQMADRAGLKMPERKASDGHFKEDTEMISAANLASAEYFHLTLMEESGAKGLEYFKSRGLTQETIRSFRLGFAEENPSGIINFAKKKGVTEQALEKAGIILSGKYGGSSRNRFAGRIIFPIFDQLGRVLGFGGRILSGDGAKYINSPETLLYRKSHILFGLFHAKNHIKRSGTAVVVEGYMDVISLHQAGLRNVIAASGTSFTVEQARMISRMAKNVILLFDGDSAGRSATVRGADNLLSTDMGIGIVTLPGDHDPDSFVREKGTEELLNLIENPIDIWEFKLRTLDGEYSTIDEKLKVAGEAADSIAIMPDEIKREIYIREISQRIGIDINAMTKAVNGRIRRKATFRMKESSEQKISGKLGEKELITSLVKYPGLAGNFLEETGSKPFSSPEIKKIAEILYHRTVEGLELSPSALIGAAEEESIQNMIASFAAGQMDEGTAGKIIEKHIKRFRENEIKEEITEISFKIVKENNLSKKEKLIKHQNELFEKLRGIMKE